MGRIIAGKALQLIPILLLVTIGTFLLIELVPGSPEYEVLGPDATPAQYAAVRQELGLDKPLVTRYTDWLSNAAQGDLGTSLIPPNQPVWEMIKDAIIVTVEITFLTLFLSLSVAIPLAMISAARAGGRADSVATGLAFAGVSLPSFLVGLLLIYFCIFHREIVKWLILAGGLVLAFAIAAWAYNRIKVARSRDPERVRFETLRGVGLAAGCALVAVFFFFRLPDFPRAGFVQIGDGIQDNLLHIALPVITLAVIETAIFTRVLRADLISTLSEDYVLSAKAKGMPRSRILVSDALRPSLFSLVTLIGVEIGRLLGGSVIVEIIFNLPGMGRLIVDAIVQKNFTVVQGAVLVIAFVYVVSLLIADIAYTFIDPRVRRASV
jgi:peptide/nickel transport system permease protein